MRGLPLVGPESLVEASTVADVESNNLGVLAQQALATGDPASAKRLASQALEQDPQDRQAKRVMDELAKQPEPAVGDPFASSAPGNDAPQGPERRRNGR